MTKVIICSAAEIDYTESLCWYSERSVDAAKKFDESRFHSKVNVYSTFRFR